MFAISTTYNKTYKLHSLSTNSVSVLPEKMKRFILVILLVFLAADIGYSRLITMVTDNSTLDLVSDGLHQSPYLSLNPSSDICEPMYGFLPCAVNIWGNLFLYVVYQYLLYLGESYVSFASDSLFHLLGPGAISSSVFQILGALSHATLVLASGIGGSKEAAQTQVKIGVSVLAGSTVYLLTLLWGLCVFFGTVDLSAVSRLFNTEALTISGSGIIVDFETRYNARIMILSVVPFVIAQLPHLMGSSSSRNVATLIAVLISAVFLFGYCIYQVFRPFIQEKIQLYMKHKFARKGFLQDLVTDDGKRPNEREIASLFEQIDKDMDKTVTRRELKNLLTGIQFYEVGFTERDVADILTSMFDKSGNDSIDKGEFHTGISNWITEFKDTKEKENVAAHNRVWAYLKAISLLVLGMSIPFVFATPLIRTVNNASTAANIPFIYVSFFLVPMTNNLRRTRAIISSILQKKEQFASITLSMIYSGAFMNNILGTFMFLGIVYVRSLAWEFSAEILVVSIVCLVMGIYVSICEKFPLWTSFMAWLLYAFSFMLLYVLTIVYGWV